MDAHDLQGSCPSCAPSLANLIFIDVIRSLSIYTHVHSISDVYKKRFFILLLRLRKQYKTGPDVSQ